MIKKNWILLKRNNKTIEILKHDLPQLTKNSIAKT